MAKKKEGVIKKLDGYIKPVVTRTDKGRVLSVDISDGQKYYIFNSLESGLIPKPVKFDESYHVGIGNAQNYLNDMAKMIENGQIYIEYVKPVVVEKKIKTKKQDIQVSMF